MIIGMLSHFVIAFFGEPIGQSPSKYLLTIASGASSAVGAYAAFLSIDAIFKAYWKKFVYVAFLLFLLIFGARLLNSYWGNEDYFKIFLAIINIVSGGYTSHLVLIKNERLYA